MKWLKNKIVIVLFLGLLLGVSLVSPWFLSVNNDNWLPPTHSQETSLAYLNEEFASGEELIIGVELEKGYFSSDSIDRLSQLEEALKLHLGRELISHRSALSAVRIANNKAVESFEAALIRGAFPRWADYQKSFDASPYRGRLLSLDYKRAAIHLRLATGKDIEKRAAVLRKINDTLAFYGLAEGRDYHLRGAAALKNEINREVETSALVLLAAAAAMLSLLLYFILGRRAPVIFLFSVAGLCVFAALSVLVLLGTPLNVITLLLPVVAAGAALTQGLHIMYYQRENPREPRALLRATRKPVGLSILALGAGVAPFIFSGLLPIAHFGIGALVMLLLLYLIVLVSFRHLSAHYGGAPPHAPFFIEQHLHKLTETCARFITHSARPITFVGIGLFVLCALCLVRWTTQTSFIQTFFKPESEIRKNYFAANEKLGGTGAVDIIIRQKKIDRFKQLDAFNVVGELTKEVQGLPNVNYVEAMDVPVRLAHKAFTGADTLPNSDGQLAQELLFLELSRRDSKDDIISPYINLNYTASRIHLRTADLSISHIEKLVRDVRALTLPANNLGEVILTGSNLWTLALSQEVFWLQWIGLAITLALLFIIFVFAFGWLQGALGFLSNLVPSGILLGAMAATGTHVNVALVLVAALTLGLTASGSIHFLYRWQEVFAGGFPPERARSFALTSMSAPIIFTTLLLATGFAALQFSPLALLVQFSAWMIVGITLAAVSSLLFLPALLAFWGNKSKIAP